MDKLFFSVFVKSASSYEFTDSYVEIFRTQYRTEAEATYNGAADLIENPNSHIYAAKLTFTTNGVTYTLDMKEGVCPLIPKKKYREDDSYGRRMHNARHRR